MIFIYTATNFEHRMAQQIIYDNKLSDRVIVADNPCGMGAAAAKKAIEDIIQSNNRITQIVSFGFAGSLSYQCPRGSVVTANSVTFEGLSYELVPSTVELGVECVAVASIDFVYHADLLPLPSTIMTSFQADSKLAGCVDMETGPLAKTAAKFGLKVLFLRLVSDDPDKPLPRFIALPSNLTKTNQRSKKIRLFVETIRHIVSDLVFGLAYLPSGRRHIQNYKYIIGQQLRSL